MYLLDFENEKFLLWLNIKLEMRFSSQLKQPHNFRTVKDRRKIPADNHRKSGLEIERWRHFQFEKSPIAIKIDHRPSHRPEKDVTSRYEKQVAACTDTHIKRNYKKGLQGRDNI